jgi:hypothetical protein
MVRLVTCQFQSHWLRFVLREAATPSDVDRIRGLSQHRDHSSFSVDGISNKRHELLISWGRSALSESTLYYRICVEVEITRVSSCPGLSMRTLGLGEQLEFLYKVYTRCSNSMTSAW